MMQFTCFYTLTSPYARKVRAFAVEHAIDTHIQWEIKNSWEEVQGVHKQNPLGKIPYLLENTNGSLYFDSRILVQKLHAYFLPQLPQPSLLQQQLHELANGIMDATVATFIEHNKREEGKQSQIFLNRYAKAITNTLQYIEKTQMQFLTQVEIGTLSTAVSLGYLDLRSPYNWREDVPKLAAWYAEFAQRPSMVISAPPK